MSNVAGRRSGAADGERRREGAAERAVCVVSTVNHLHLVVNLARTIRDTWSGSPPILTVLADDGDVDHETFLALGVELVPAATLDVPDALWLAAKYDATELCCALKPFAVRHALARGYAQVVYCDSDLHFFAEPTSLLDLGVVHDVVVTPHTLEPFPASEAWQRPTLGDLSGAGVMNAGLFSMRDTAAARAFLDTWSGLVVAPGAFLLDLGGQHEQNFFNWVIAFAEDVAICRDRTLNVAYWNLHERPLRWAALDGGAPDAFTVGGRPLGSFHFSGFAWRSGRLSKHDFRHLPELDVNVDALCRFYDERLHAAGSERYGAQPYAFAEIDGHRLTAEVRDALKRAEERVSPLVASWSEDAPPLLTMLNHVIGPTCLVPQYLEQVMARRPDLRTLNADDTVFPERLLDWAGHWLAREYPHGWLYERFCPFAWDRQTVDRIAAELVRQDARLGLDDARDLVVHDRARALDVLAGVAGANELTALLEGGGYRFAAYDPALCLRLVYFSREDLRRTYRDPLGEDLDGFRGWIASQLRAEYVVPEAVAAFAEALAPGRSLARVVSFLRGTRVLHERFAQSGLDVALLRDLVPASTAGVGYTPSDLVLVDWWLRDGHDVEARARPRPARRGSLLDGLRAAVAGANGAHEPNAGEPPPLGDAARALLPDRLVVREPGDPRFARFLASWLETRDGSRPPRPERRRRLADAAVQVVADLARDDGPGFVARAMRAIAAVPDRGVRRDVERLFTPEPRGVNVFGYFKSPIGLGTATHGVCAALELAGYRHRDVVLPNMTMAADLDVEDLVPDFAFEYPRNLVVSYPHIQCDAFDVFPDCFFAGRENIGYLAWEQRDLHPEWAKRLARYDRLFALSDFAARAIADGVGRPVGVLPCVVQVDTEAAAGFTRADFGIPADSFAAGFVFDASSSVERKNPLGAVRALERAFAGHRDVVVVMKITNGDRHPYARAVDQIVRELRAAGLESVVVTRVLPRAAVEGLIASLDLYLSLHRAEGFGYTLAEAMLLGVPALATRYSGNLDFMTDQNAWLVECRETIVRKAEGPFRLGTVWADPDLDAAAATCRRVYDDRDEARRRAAQAQRDVAALLSPGAVARRIAEVLDAEPVTSSRRAAAQPERAATDRRGTT